MGRTGAAETNHFEFCGQASVGEKLRVNEALASCRAIEAEARDVFRWWFRSVGRYIAGDKGQWFVDVGVKIGGEGGKKP